MTSTWSLRHGPDPGQPAKVVTMHRNRIFVVSILLQFQFVASSLVLDFCVGSFGVSLSHRLRRCLCRLVFCCRHWLRLIQRQLLGFVFFLGFFILFFESAFGSVLANICQQQHNGQNLNWFIAVFRFFFRACWNPYMVFLADDCELTTVRVRLKCKQ